MAVLNLLDKPNDYIRHLYIKLFHYRPLSHYALFLEVTSTGGCRKIYHAQKTNALRINFVHDETHMVMTFKIGNYHKLQYLALISPKCRTNANDAFFSCPCGMKNTLSGWLTGLSNISETFLNIAEYVVCLLFKNLTETHGCSHCILWYLHCSECF